MEPVPYFDFYHDHPYHQLNIGQEVEVVHEDIPKIFECNNSSPIFDKSVIGEVINKGLPIPEEWLESWKHVTIKELKQHVDLDVIFKNWDAVLPKTQIKKDSKIPKLLSRPASREREKTPSETVRKSILLQPSQLPVVKKEKQWEINCQFCHKNLKGGKKRYEAHLKNSHEVLCKCGKEFHSKVKLMTHVKKEKNYNLHGPIPGANNITPLFECDFCDEIFRSLSIAEKHRKMVHGTLISNEPAPAPAPCPSPSPRAITFNCTQCKLELKDRVSLFNHQASNTCPRLKKKISKYFCSVCHKDFYCKKTCREHLKKVHNIRSRAEVSVFVNQTNDKPSPTEQLQKGDSQREARRQRKTDPATDSRAPNLINYANRTRSNIGNNNVLPTHTKAGSVIYYSLARSNIR